MWAQIRVARECDQGMNISVLVTNKLAAYGLLAGHAVITILTILVLK